MPACASSRRGAAARPTPLPTPAHASTCADDDRSMVVAWFLRGHRRQRSQARCHRRRHDPGATPPPESLRDGQPCRHDVYRPVQQPRPVGDWRRNRRRRHCGDPRHARTIEVPSGLVDPVTRSRAEQAAALERWADAVEPDDLRVADTDALRTIAELIDQRRHVDTELTRAVRSAQPHIDHGPRSGPCSASPSKQHNASTETRPPHSSATACAHGSLSSTWTRRPRHPTPTRRSMCSPSPFLNVVLGLGRIVFGGLERRVENCGKHGHALRAFRVLADGGRCGRSRSRPSPPMPDHHP